jgi:hypothetical protein
MVKRSIGRRPAEARAALGCDDQDRSCDAESFNAPNDDHCIESHNKHSVLILLGPVIPMGARFPGDARAEGGSTRPTAFNTEFI